MPRYSRNGLLKQAVKCLSTLVLAVSIVSCGGGSNSKSGSSNSKSGVSNSESVGSGSGDSVSNPSDDNTTGGVHVSENLRILSVASPKDFQTDTDSGLLISERVQFPLALPENTVSFQLVSRGADAISSLFNSLENPNGVELLVAEALRIRNMREDYSSILVPQGPQFTANSGPASYTMQANEIPSDLTLTLALRTGPIPSNGASLKVKPFLASASHEPADIQPALVTVQNIFEQAGITLDIRETEALTDPAFYVVSTSFTDPTTAALVSRGAAGEVNIFFIDDSEGLTSGLLGIAPGIGGTLGIAGNRNGVLIGLDGHSIGGQLSIDFLGETAAHEIGHFLGLFHTTERNGLFHDIIEDTPECEALTQDTDNDNIVELSECTDLGSTNLMFWQGNGVTRQTGLTQGQAHVIMFSPLAE